MANKTTEGSDAPVGYEVVPSTTDTRCPSLEEIRNKKKEIWLIKVPFNFDRRSLSGETFVLNGSQDLLVTQANTKKYEISSRALKSHDQSSCKVLLPSTENKSVWSARPVNGHMTVIQSRHVPIADIAPCPPPTKHKVPDIRCRWKPFGSGDPDDSADRLQENHVPTPPLAYTPVRSLKEEQNLRESLQASVEESLESHEQEKKAKKKNKQPKIKHEPESPKQNSMSMSITTPVNLKQECPTDYQSSKKKKPSKPPLGTTQLDQVKVKKERLSDDDSPAKKKKKKNKV
ncbi:uncharacterized protein LOC5520336 [Nematostella vectensis]|uniref:uncharacterized protein LOC5520336 n=1 Tax=Nematostella vectensis TaxID=45351 RepID=UPI002077502C|nr:uncharacterized protein LOC5520336 [Nematostella vectensis]